MNIKDELKDLRLEYGTYEANKEYCDEKTSKKYEKILTEENSDISLPENIVYELDDSLRNYKFYYIKDDRPTLNEKELQEYLSYKQLEQLEKLSTIKNCIVFFTVCLVIELVCQVINLLSAGL